MRKLSGIVSRQTARAMVLASTMASTDVTRPALRQVLVRKLGNRLHVVGTDTYRLLVADIAEPSGRWLKPGKEDWQVPAAAVTKAMATRAARAVGLLALDGMEVAAAGGRGVVTEPEEWGVGTYPDYLKVIPRTAGRSMVRLPLSRLAAAARFALLAPRVGDPGVVAVLDLFGSFPGFGERVKRPSWWRAVFLGDSLERRRAEAIARWQLVVDALNGLWGPSFPVYQKAF